MYGPAGMRAMEKRPISRNTPVLIPISQVTARVNGGRLSVIGSPLLRTGSPPVPFYSLKAGSLALRHWDDRQAAMAGPVDRSYCEYEVVFGQLHGCPRHVPDIVRVLPF